MKSTRRIIVNIEYELTKNCQKTYEIDVDTSSYAKEGVEYGESDYSEWAREDAQKEAEKRLKSEYDNGILGSDHEDDEELENIDAVAE